MMFAVKPVPVTDSILIGSSFAETDYPAWSSATTYAKGDRVIRTGTHRIYESASNSNLNRIPENTTPTWWLEVEATNKWKPFDDRLSIRAANVGNIWWNLLPGTRCNFVGVFGVLGETASLIIRNALDVTVSTHLNDLVTTYPSGAPDWTNRYDVIRLKDSTAFLDLNIPDNHRVQVGVNGSAGTIRWAGEIVIGNAVPIGTAGAGSSVGYTDYSSKTRDYYGDVVRVRRPAGDHAIFHVKCLSAEVPSILAVLRSLRFRPTAYFTTSHETFDSMIFGWAKDPLIIHDDGVNATYSLEVEGAT